MTCPDRYQAKLYWWEKNPYRCARDTEPCSLWRVGWCKGYIPIVILIIAAGLYFGIGLAKAMEKTENQIIVTEGSLQEYKAAKKRSASINGCFGWDEQAQKYRVWKWDSEVCQN